MHFSQKKTGAICNSVCPHSSFLQCAINEGRRGRCLISSKQKELTFLGIWVQAVLFWTLSMLCFIGNMVSRYIQVLQCLYITWVSYVTILNSAILKSACCGRLRPWTILICTVFFSCVLWLPLLVFPSTYTANSQLVWFVLFAACVTFTTWQNSKPRDQVFSITLKLGIWLVHWWLQFSLGYVEEILKKYK